jgi:hypothetical protein
MSVCCGQELPFGTGTLTAAMMPACAPGGASAASATTPSQLRRAARMQRSITEPPYPLAQTAANRVGYRSDANAGVSLQTTTFPRIPQSRGCRRRATWKRSQPGDHAAPNPVQHAGHSSYARAKLERFLGRESRRPPNCRQPLPHIGLHRNVRLTGEAGNLTKEMSQIHDRLRQPDAAQWFDQA